MLAFLGLAGLLSAPISAQGLTCFESGPAPPWEASTVGVIEVAASRVTAKKVFELCSISRGFGDATDQLCFLYRPVRADFEMLARLNDVSQTGLGGVMARLDVRTGDFPYVQISVKRLQARVLVLSSSFRPNAGEPASDGGSLPVVTGLPVWLRLRREGDLIVTSFSSDGRNFREHLRVMIAESQLENLFLSAGMTQASGSGLPGTAVFTSPSVKTTETRLPPVILSVQPPNAPLEGGGEVTIRGRGFSAGNGIRAVSLAGIPAKVLRVTDDSIVVKASPAPRATVGDVVVEGSGGEEYLENGFAYLGHMFIRGDSNGDDIIDIGDPVGLLTYLFLGGRPPQCLDAADIDANDVIDIGDPVGLLTYLFLGGRPPVAPFPAPGLVLAPGVPCGMPEGPRILAVSPRDLTPGDVVKLEGEGFSRVPEENLVYFGSSRVQILEASPTVLRGRMGDAARAGPVLAAAFGSLSIHDSGPCKTKSCFPAHVGLVGFASEVHVNLESPNTRSLGGAKADPANPGALVLSFDEERWNPESSYSVRGRLNVPPLTGLSRGNFLLDFAYQQAVPGIGFDQWLQGLAGALNRKLNGGGDAQEIVVSTSRSTITLELRPEIADRAGLDWQDSTIDCVTEPPPSLPPCAIFADLEAHRREMGWCMFGELIKDCGGLPSWEYFIPKHLVFQASDSIFPLPSPLAWSPMEKVVLYNRDAYCHVRTKGLYKACVLDFLAVAGPIDEEDAAKIPAFPLPAVILKTRWASQAQMTRDGKNTSKHYSYVSGGTRWYLTLLHFMDKSVTNPAENIKWFFADAYVPEPDGYGGCGGSGADRPASITGIWANYALCTNLFRHEGGGHDCGNAVIDGECNRNCRWCHPKASWSTADGKTASLDSVFSIGTGAITGPPGCP